MKLALGTAQFGMAYGIANRGGQVGRGAAKDVLALARTGGIDTLDTAIAYGESEICLGEAGVAGFNIVTKLPPMPLHVDDAYAWVCRELHDSLARLRVSSVHGLLLHRSQQLVGPEGPAVARALQHLKSEGLVRKIGVSIYSPSELGPALEACRLDLVQAPLNVLDRRILQCGWADRLKQWDIELHARSAFLQGLLLMPAAARPAIFARWAPLLSAWDDWLEKTRQTPLQAALGFALAQPQIDRVVAGVDDPLQLQEILAATRDVPQAPPSGLQSDDLDLINPANWPALERASHH